MLFIVIGKPSEHVRQLVESMEHFAHGAVQVAHPPVTFVLNAFEAQTQVFVAVIGNPSVQVTHFVADVMQVAQVTVQFRH